MGHSTRTRDTTTANYLGSLVWMAPERFADPTTIPRRREWAIDVYAYGCICYLVRHYHSESTLILIDHSFAQDITSFRLSLPKQWFTASRTNNVHHDPTNASTKVTWNLGSGN